MKQLCKVFFVLCISLGPFSLFAHEKEKHHAPEKIHSANVLEEINQHYKSHIKQIFKTKCFDCHSKFVNYPWYYKIPIIKGFIDKDIREGKEHLDLGNDFPFGGHGTPKEDLEAIKKSIEDDSMPPFRYKIMHRNSGLTGQEKDAIIQWISKSVLLLDKQ